MAKIVSVVELVMFFFILPSSWKTVVEAKPVDNKSFFHSVLPDGPQRNDQIVRTGDSMPQIDGPLIAHHSLSFATKFGWFRPISDGTNLIRLD